MAPKKLLIISGPTSSGKTSLALILAKHLNAEIVSADSRHVYKGMDIGTGKDIDKNSKLKTLASPNENFSVGFRRKEGIPIWLVDVVRPDYHFNLGDWYRLVESVISNISARNKLPIIVGGTGLYIKSLLVPLKNILLKPNLKLRKKLESKSLFELQNLLKQRDPSKYSSLNYSDSNNPRRLIRGIEIAGSDQKSSFRFINYNWRLVYLDLNLKQLYEKIDARVDQRLKQGIIAEIQKLINLGYNFDLQSFSASPYYLFKSYFNSDESDADLNKIIVKWKYREHALARSQKIWFKKMLKNLPKEKIIKLDFQDRLSSEKIMRKIRTWYTSIDPSTKD